MVTYFDLVFVLLIIGTISGFVIRRFNINVKKDGYQSTDIACSINEGIADYKATLANIESVIEDVTVDDADTIRAIKTFIVGLKTFK